MSSAWAKGCMLMIVCLLSDMTTPPWWREKVTVYYYIIYIVEDHQYCFNYTTVIWISVDSSNN